MASETKFFKCGMLNVQSIRNKTTIIRELIREINLDILILTETWLSHGVQDQSRINDMLPNTHTFHHKPREEKTGGGVGVFLSKQFSNIRIMNRIPYDTFEHLEIKFNYGNKVIVMVALYRPPEANVAQFNEEFNSYLDLCNDELMRTYICGDFNIWLDDLNNNSANNFKETIDSHNLENKVLEPTSRSNHVLDLIICDKDFGLIREIEVEPDFAISYYHKLVLFNLCIEKSGEISNKITFREKKNLNPQELIGQSMQTMIRKNAEVCKCYSDEEVHSEENRKCVNCYTQMYREVFTEKYNEMCPVIEKNIKIRDAAPWFNTEIREARKRRRLAEIKWRKRKTEELRKQYVISRNEVIRQIKIAKEQYCKRKIHEAGTDMNKLNKLFRELLGGNKKKMLPEGDTEEGLSNKFGEHFDLKIENIYNSFDAQRNGDCSFLPEFPFNKLRKFEPIDLTELIRLVKETKKTYSDNDPFPISDMEQAQNFNEVINVYHKIVNMSLEQAVFPQSEKCAYVKPAFKGKGDYQTLDSYRPISNLSFLSKIIELVVQRQLIVHLEKVNILPENQSAYRKGHSTETALVSVLNDLLKMLDNGKCGILILLDLSAAFDTVVHELLLEDLVLIGIDDDALKWFKSYLSDRSFRVSIGTAKSERRKLTRGVPQGSVLGPILFSIYTIELSSILKRHDVQFKFFADDTQFYFIVENMQNTMEKINAIMAEVRLWMDKKKLKLNESKTECMLVGTRRTLTNFSDFQTVYINNTEVKTTKTVKNLGFIFDQHLTLREQVQSVVKSGNYHLRNIAFIKRYLDEKSLKTLVNNYVVTRLDYCNSMYYNLPCCLLKRIQGTFNKAARLIMNKPPWERITPSLVKLHWLPIKARIEFKICVMTYLALNTDRPRYLKDYLMPFSVATDVILRHSMDRHRLLEPRANLELGMRAFENSAPRLYNKLPQDIKESGNIEVFKKGLKTYLFRTCYDLEEEVIREPYTI